MSTRYRTATDITKCAARMIRAAGARVAHEDPDQLAELVALADVLSDAIQAAVDGQRAAGITWQWIGEATGTTKQAAIQKWANRTNDGES